ncbi:MAG: carboxypeptidase-like regulatory domain-containing protein, partial [Chitinophagaceae bacterium]
MKIMKILAFISVFFCCSILNAQTATSTVKGKVVNDSTGKPLQSASITVVGSKRGTTTDADGNFTIKFPADGKPHKLT